MVPIIFVTILTETSIKYFGESIYSFNIQHASLVITIQLVAAPGRLAHSHVSGIENPKSAQYNKYKRRMWAQEIHTGLESD